MAKPAGAVPPHPSFPHHVAWAASPTRKAAAPAAPMLRAATAANAASANANAAPPPQPSSYASSSPCPDQSLAAEALLPLLAYLDTVRAAEHAEHPPPAYDDARANASASASAEAAAEAGLWGGPRRRRPAAVAAAGAAGAPNSAENEQQQNNHGRHSSGGGSVIVVRGSNGGSADAAVPPSDGNDNSNGSHPSRNNNTTTTTNTPRSSVAQRWRHLWTHGRGSRHFAPEELRRGLDRLWQASTRGAAVGLTLRGGLHVVGALAGAVASAGGGARGTGGAARAAAAATTTPALPRRRAAVSPAEALLDTLRYGAFLGALAGTMVGADEAIAATVGRRNSAGWRAFVAGVCAGPSLLLTGPQSRHYSLATYVLLRGVTLLVRVGNKRVVEEEGEEADEWEERLQQLQQGGGGRNANAHARGQQQKQRRTRLLRRLLRLLLWPTRLKHGDVLLMCLACSQILYAFIMEPASLPPSYVRFILRQGDKDPAVWAGIRELAARTRAGDTAARAAGLSGAMAAASVARAVSAAPLEALKGSPALAAAAEAARQGVVAATAGGGGSSGSGNGSSGIGGLLGLALGGGGGHLAPLTCAFFHPGQSCAGHAAAFVPGAWLRALRVYVPVYLLPMLLVHRGRLLSPGAALPLLRRAAAGVARSSLFLSLAIGLAFGGACCGFHLSGRATGAVIAAWTWPAGLATFVEKKSRRMELALYVAARSLESLSRCLAIWGYLPAPHAPAPSSLPSPSSAAAAALVARRAPSRGALPGSGRRPSSSAATATVAAHLRPLIAAALRRYDVLLFALGCGAIAHCYGGSRGAHRDVFRSKYLAVFDFVFGNAGFSAGAVRHEPSNADLLRGAGMRVAQSIGRISSMTGLAAVGGGGNGGGSSTSLAALVLPSPPLRPSRLAPPPPSPVLVRSGGGGGGGDSSSSGSSSSSSSSSSIGSNSSGGGGRGGGGGNREEEETAATPPAAAPARSPSFVSAASGGVAVVPSSSVATFATASSREGSAV